MLKISISVEGAFGGLDWPRWKRLVQEIETLGFAGIYLSDHFKTSGSAKDNSLELMVALTYLADHTSRVHFGSLVAPLSFRDPVFLARQAAAIDELSGGRMILGLGAGWQEQEHTMFGYDLSSVRGRMDRFAEGLAVITGLLRDDQPLSYEGQYYQLNEAVLAGPRQDDGPAILIGGSGPKRTLPLVARYADIWNGQLILPDEYREKSAYLDSLLVEAGRTSSDVKRTMLIPLLIGRNQADLETQADKFRRLNPAWAKVSFDDLIAGLRGSFKSLIVGTPETVIPQLRAYAEVGVTEIMLQWGDLDNIDDLRLLAEAVLPYVSVTESEVKTM